MFLATWSQSRLKKKQGAGAAWEKNQGPEPEPLEKKSGVGAGAGKKFAGSPALHITHHVENEILPGPIGNSFPKCVGTFAIRLAFCRPSFIFYLESFRNGLEIRKNNFIQFFLETNRRIFF